MWFRFKLYLDILWHRIRGKKHPLEIAREREPYIYEE
jgi:hypothetical protein